MMSSVVPTRNVRNMCTGHDVYSCGLYIVQATAQSVANAAVHRDAAVLTLPILVQQPLKPQVSK